MISTQNRRHHKHIHWSNSYTNIKHNGLKSVFGQPY